MYIIIIHHTYFSCNILQYSTTLRTWQVTRHLLVEGVACWVDLWEFEGHAMYSNATRRASLPPPPVPLSLRTATPNHVQQRHKASEPPLPAYPSRLEGRHVQQRHKASEPPLPSSLPSPPAHGGRGAMRSATPSHVPQRHQATPLSAPCPSRLEGRAVCGSAARRRGSLHRQAGRVTSHLNMVMPRFGGP